MSSQPSQQGDEFQLSKELRRFEFTGKGQVPDDDVYDPVKELGGGHDIVSDKLVVFDHAFAELILGALVSGEKGAYQTLPYDKPLDNKQCIDLVRAMKQGTFTQETVIIATAELKGVIYRINGKHCSWARLDVDESIMFKVRHIHYTVKSDDGLRLLYASYDRAKNRTQSQVTAAYLVGRTEFDGVKKGVLTLLPRGFPLYFWPDANVRAMRSADEIGLLLRSEELNTAVRVAQFLSKMRVKQEGHVLKPYVVAAMMYTFGKAPRISEAFWTPVATGANLKTGTAEMKLAEKLKEWGVRGCADKPSDEYLLRFCLWCYNKSREEAVVKNIPSNLEEGERPKLL